MKSSVFKIDYHYSLDELKLNHVYPDEYLLWVNLGYDCHGGMRKRRQRANQILISALDYVISNIILYDKYYKSPYHGKYYWIMSMQAKSTREVDRIAKRNTLYQHVDLIKTQGMIYQIGMFFPMMPHGKKRVRVHVGKKYWYALEEMANNGMVYQLSQQLNQIQEQIKHRDVVKHVCSLFPDWDKKAIARTIRFGLRRIGQYNTNGAGVKFTSSANNFHFHSFYHKILKKEDYQRARAATYAIHKARQEGRELDIDRIRKKITWRRTKTSLKKACN